MLQVARRQQLHAKVGLNIGVGFIIIGSLLVVLGLTGSVEFVADRGRIVTIPTGLLLAVVGSIVIWVTRPSIIP